MTNPDQWKQGGDCSVCRRANYCRKRCREHKAFMQRAIRQVFAASKAGKIMNAIKKTMYEQGHEMEYLDG